MLAYLTEDEIEHLYPDENLPVSTPNTITTKTALKAAISEARIKGYAFDNEESEEGLWAVAGCVRNKEGHPLAAISVVAPLFRIKNKNYQDWYKLVWEGSAEVTAILNFK